MDFKKGLTNLNKGQSYQSSTSVMLRQTNQVCRTMTEAFMVRKTGQILSVVVRKIDFKITRSPPKQSDETGAPTASQ